MRPGAASSPWGKGTTQGAPAAEGWQQAWLASLERSGTGQGVGQGGRGVLLARHGPGPFINSGTGCRGMALRGAQGLACAPRAPPAHAPAGDGHKALRQALPGKMRKAFKARLAAQQPSAMTASATQARSARIRDTETREDAPSKPSCQSPGRKVRTPVWLRRFCQD
jgi:hypothetical protein